MDKEPINVAVAGTSKRNYEEKEKQEDRQQMNYRIRGRGSRGREQVAMYRQTRSSVSYNWKRYGHFSKCYNRLQSRIAEKSNFASEEEQQTDSIKLLTYIEERLVKIISGTLT